MICCWHFDRYNLHIHIFFAIGFFEVGSQKGVNNKTAGLQGCRNFFCRIIVDVSLVLTITTQLKSGTIVISFHKTEVQYTIGGQLLIARCYEFANFISVEVGNSKTHQYHMKGPIFGFKFSHILNPTLRLRQVDAGQGHH